MSWSGEDSAKLKDAVLSVVSHDDRKVCWPTVHQLLLDRFPDWHHSSKSRRLRYQNQLAADLNDSKLTPDEDEAIMFWVALWGNKWSKIAALISIDSEPQGRRTDNKVKNRYMSHLESKVVGPRRQAVKAVEKGRTGNKHRRVLEEYIQGLTAMRAWVLATDDIRPGDKDMRKLDDKIRTLKALQEGRDPTPDREASRGLAAAPASMVAEARNPRSGSMARNRSASTELSMTPGPRGWAGSPSPSTPQPLPQDGSFPAHDRTCPSISDLYHTFAHDPYPGSTPAAFPQAQQPNERSFEMPSSNDDGGTFMDHQQQTLLFEDVQNDNPTAATAIPAVAIHEAFNADMAAIPNTTCSPFDNGSFESEIAGLWDDAMDSEALDWDLLLPAPEGGEHYDELFSNPIGMVTGFDLPACG